MAELSLSFRLPLYNECVSHGLVERYQPVSVYSQYFYCVSNLASSTGSLCTSLWHHRPAFIRFSSYFIVFLCLLLPSVSINTKHVKPSPRAALKNRSVRITINARVNKRHFFFLSTVTESQQFSSVFAPCMAYSSKTGVSGHLKI